MGRGRAKAKQTKVARELKYRSPHTDFSSLARELRGGDEAEVPEAYADLADSYDDDGEGEYAVSSDQAYENLRRSG
jgi:hypothetical protein